MLQKKTQGYLIHAIAGALLLPILYYYSLKKNSIMCALIPTIPILGLYGLICTIDDNGNIEKYLKNIIIFGLMFVVLFLLMYFFYSYTNNIYISSIISLIIWFAITMTYIVYC
tara:strand:+ start:215 stop:553 length:339 start_codon:yes stop_codon:yes gene_type:complete